MFTERHVRQFIYYCVYAESNYNARVKKFSRYSFPKKLKLLYTNINILYFNLTGEKKKIEIFRIRDALQK